MKKILLLLLTTSTFAMAQNVAINDNGAVGNSNSILDVDVSTNNKGVIIPRLSTAQRIAIPGLAMADEGLTVYDETTNSFWFWDGTQWVQLQNAGAAGWLTTGNAGTVPATNFVGTTDNVDFVTRTNNTEKMRVTTAGNVGIGTATPAYRLDLANGTFGFGSSNVRTETRANAGLQGNAGAQSGFFETEFPVNYPAGAASWWHLIDTRHSNNANNYAMQISGSFFDQELWFRKTNGNAAQPWSRLLSTSNVNGYAWTTLGNSGTNAAVNFVGTTDNVDFVTRTNNTEKMRVTAGGNVGIGTTVPNETFSVVKTQAGWQSRFNNNSGTGSDVYLAHGGGYGMHIRGWNANDAVYTLEMYNLSSRTNVFYNSGRVGLGLVGFVGVGTETPAARLHVVNGSIRPQTGNDAVSGVYFTPNPGGGGGDEAYIRHYVEAGENTKLVIANTNDADDDIAFKTGIAANERVNINGNGTVYLNRGVFFDCNDCGGVGNGQYDLPDGAGGNWGDLSIQGRVLSSNSNIHLSPPGGARVIINSSYRAAGGVGGTTGLDVEDGGIRFRKNYRWINRYGSTGGYGWGSQLHNLGAWDFCAISHVGFRNTNSVSDEDDDVQCAVYPNAHVDYGSQNQWDSWFTYQYNARPNWYMYLEGYADTNETNCAAMCMNFD